MMRCTKCHFENPRNGRFCHNCGTPLPSTTEIATSPPKNNIEETGELTRGTAFAGRYEVIEELGKGGMGKVYRVLDNKINEEVALKLINSEIASDKKVIERFSNELKMARKVSHKNICRLYHLGEENGFNYITMEYVPGESLKSMIGMTKQLSTTTAVNIAKQICEGLTEAHRLDVIHRDLKSKNIMIDKNGNARIMDFGIGDSLQAKGKTDLGTMIGSPAYMSPEQVEGKETDRRSDIYSLGVIMFEMITGRLPFNGDNPLSIALKHKTEAPPDPRDFNAQVPLEFTRVILRCMEKDKDKRFQDAKELHSELSNIEKEISSEERPIPKKMTPVSNGVKSTFTKRWILVAALVLVIVVAGIAGLYLNKETPVLPSGQKMLVVLPLKNLGAPADEYFADGITEEITSRLAALQGLGVISRTSANRYKNANKTIREIGEELDVDYILEGAVRWDRSTGGNGRVRVTSQLIRVSDDTHLWSERYDRIINDIFSVQTEIAEEVASQLDLTVLSPERKVLSTSPTDNLEAYDSYMRGIEHMNRGWRYSAPQEFEKAVQLFEKATELDPSFALAYANLSIIHSRTYFFGLDQTEERLNRSRAAADRALELKPALPDAHQALALYYYWGLLDYDRAAEVFENLKKSWPNFSGELPGYILRRQGKWEQALATLEKAFKLNPFFSQLAYEIGGAYLSMRRYEKAEEWFDRTLSINPDCLMPKLQKIGIHILSKGNIKKARALLETLSQHPFTDYMWFTLGMLERDYQGVLDRLASLPYDSFKEQHFYFHKDLAYASVYHAMKEMSSAKTHAESARIVLEKAMDEYSGDPRFHAALGLVYAYLGRKDDALREGNRATTLYPVTKDAALGPVYILNLAKIYSLAGEYDEAIDRLNYLLSVPNAEFLWQIISVPSLRLDPQWDSLRNNPKFQDLLEKYS